jgi:raffinose/stachyose/melibiose transport system permease protein
VATSFPFPRRSPVRVTFGIGLAALTVFGLVPAVAVLVVSFTDLRGLPYLPVDWVGIQNYVTFFSPAKWPDSLNALRNTVVFAVVSTVFQIALALAIALLLNRPLRGRSFYRGVVFMPTILGVTVTGLVWSLIFNVNRGPATSLLSLFGGRSAFFGDPTIALALVIVVQVWMVLGVAVIIFLSGLQSIPDELSEAANIDGAGAWKRLRFITFPLLAPAITANVLLSIVNALQSYQLTYVLSGPSNPATQVLSLLVYVQGFGGVSGTAQLQSQGYASAVSIVQFVLVGVVSLIALRFLRRREARL